MAAAARAVQPTRGELLKLRKRIDLAKRGHELLKEKRDALVTEFFDTLDRFEKVRGEMREKLENAFEKLIYSQIIMGSLDLRKAVEASMRDLEVDIGTRNIMGVKVPVVEPEDVRRKIMERGYSLHQSSPKLDEAAKEFESVLETILELAEIYKTVKLLAREIEKTKRRVNSLEHVLIPRIEESIEYIEMRLEELERENFFRLKRVKAEME
ncbi:ATP synthase subunit D [candidate division MSBL1 archaeon SCGC-AAA261G05]|uniref:A-type ATP synthase subunit D n=2 Tax=candidate division MSBL1 TaxID=215777 RepID=A0A133VB96_9EURY|nr:ATP synthase subunit D [candidate division MSBL1 archaeon SCGC-AAA261G05]KXB04145.1 ATP synthase subunit D [candidate division MSBL1 archaeon SCGC-AAA261O19]